MTRVLAIAAAVWLKMIRRKDIYVLSILLLAVLMALTSLNVFGLADSSRYVEDLGMSLTWVLAWLLAVITASRELPQEERDRTVYPLLAKPITRIELVIGKWLGCWSITSASVFMFYLLVYTLTRIKGADAINETVWLQGFLLHCIAIGIMSSVGIAFSTRMNQDAATTMGLLLTGVSLVLVPRVPEFMTTARGFSAGMLLFIYNAAPHLEVFDLRRLMVHNYPPAPPRVLIEIMVLGFLWISFFLLVAWMAYRHKRFSRGVLK